LERIEVDPTLSPRVIPARIFNELCKHAVEGDEECCGLVVSEGGERYGRVITCRNEMTQLHERDPETHPRDGRSAYHMNAGSVLKISREVERTGDRVSAVYHSHVGAGAYLSEIDLEYAAHPLFPFPDADQIVLSTFENRVREVAIFVPEDGTFVGRRLAASVA
jgi:proteasome lid subunit RPN8/RPN11